MKTPSSRSPAEVMLALRIQSVYDKLLPKQTKPATASILPTKYTTHDRKFNLKFKDNKSFWEAGTIEKRNGNLIYIVKGPKFTHKRHLNQVKKRSTNVPDNGPTEDVAMDVIYDTFDIPTPLVIPDVRRSKKNERRPTR